VNLTPRSTEEVDFSPRVEIRNYRAEERRRRAGEDNEFYRSSLMPSTSSFDHSSSFDPPSSFGGGPFGGASPGDEHFGGGYFGGASPGDEHFGGGYFGGGGSYSNLDQSIALFDGRMGDGRMGDGGMGDGSGRQSGGVYMGGVYMGGGASSESLLDDQLSRSPSDEDMRPPGWAADLPDTHDYSYRDRERETEGDSDRER